MPAGLLEAYSLLNYIKLEWSLGKRPSPEVMDILERRYGVRTLLDLDRVVHELHKRLARNPPEPYIRARGDGLVIAGMLRAAGIGVIEAEGDGWREPLYLLTDSTSLVVRLRPPAEAVVSADLDYVVPAIEFVDKYFVEYADREELEAYVDGECAGAAGRGLYFLRVLGWHEEAAEEALRYYGFRVEGRRAEDENFVVILARPESPSAREDPVLALGRARMATEVLAGGDYEEVQGGYAATDRVKALLDRVGYVLPARVVPEKVEEAPVHPHGADMEVHVHVDVRVRLVARDVGALFASVVALVAALDTNLERTPEEEALARAARVAGELSRISARWRRESAWSRSRVPEPA